RKIVHAAHAVGRATSDTCAGRLQTAPRTMINDDDIRSLLEAPSSGEEAPTLDHIEHTLTAGYARALALEAERWRVERRIADVAARLGDEVTDEDASELAQLGQQLSS